MLKFDKHLSFHLKTMTSNKFRTWIAPIIATLIFIGLWQAAITGFGISHLILPNPRAVFFALVHRIDYLLLHGVVTLAEAFMGFFLGSLFGIGLAATFVFSRTAERALYPYAIAMKAIPLVALAPLIVAWCGGGLLSKIILAAIISFFPVLVSAADGFKSVDPDSLELMRSLSATRWDTFFRLKWPHALPQIFAGLKVASSFSVVGAVVAEFVNAESGIGYVIKSTSYYLDTEITFAAIFIAAGASLLFFSAVSWLQRIVLPWQKQVGHSASPS